MEHWDAEREQRVWRRVRGEGEKEDWLPELVRLSRDQAAESEASIVLGSVLHTWI